MKEAVFQGSCTAMITPFTPSGLDLERMGELLDHQALNGTSAVLIAGTTGESPTLESHEFEELVAFSVRHNAGRMKVVVGVGGNSTEHCLRKALQAEQLGADAILMSPPYYNKCSPSGLIEHFSYVADHCTLPLILYNVPSRTVVGLTLDAYRQLAQHPRINGVKEASGDFTLISQLCTLHGLHVWSGNDEQTVPMMALGALGVISVCSNLIPATMAELCACCAQGDFAAARTLHCRCAPLMSALFAECNPIPVKAAMALLGRDSGRLRLPLTTASPITNERLRTRLQEFSLC